MLVIILLFQIGGVETKLAQIEDSLSFLKSYVGIKDSDIVKIIEEKEKEKRESLQLEIKKEQEELKKQKKLEKEKEKKFYLTIITWGGAIFAICIIYQLLSRLLN